MPGIEELRRTLRSLEDNAPDPEVMLDRLHAQVSEKTRTRWLGPVLIAAVVLVAVLVPFAIVHRKPAGPGPAATNSATDLNWRFSVDPVPGLQIIRTVAQPNVQIAAILPSNKLANVGELLVFTPGLARPVLTGAAPATVDGRPAEAGNFVGLLPAEETRPGTSRANWVRPALVWSYGPGAWAMVVNTSPLPDTAADRARRATVAAAVRTSTDPLRLGVRLGWLPAGISFENAIYDLRDTQLGVGFADGRPAAPGQDPLGGSALSVVRLRTQPGLTNGTHQVTVQGRVGYLDDHELQVDLADGSTLEIFVDPAHLDRISDADLLHIADKATPVGRTTNQQGWPTVAEALPRR